MRSQSHEVCLGTCAHTCAVLVVEIKFNREGSSRLASCQLCDLEFWIHGTALIDGCQKAAGLFEKPDQGFAHLMSEGTVTDGRLAQGLKSVRHSAGGNAKTFTNLEVFKIAGREHVVLLGVERHQGSVSRKQGRVKRSKPPCAGGQRFVNRRGLGD